MEKSKAMLDLLDRMFPKMVERVAELRCASCAAPINKEDFRDALSVKEYGISGLCQKCQDNAFGGPKEDE